MVRQIKLNQIDDVMREAVEDLVAATTLEWTARTKKATPVRVVYEGEPKGGGQLRNAWQTEIKPLKGTIINNLAYAEPVCFGTNLPPSWGGRVLGKGLGIAASPGVLAPLAALDITRQVSEGDSLEDIATNPFNYTYPIFAEQTPRLTRGLPSAFRKFASLGLSKPALRLLSRAGIAGLGASLAIQGLGLTDD